MFSVINKDNNLSLSNEQILEEVNRDRSEEWTAYDLEDLQRNPCEVLDWIDRQYFFVNIKEEGKPCQDLQ